MGNPRKSEKPPGGKYLKSTRGGESRGGPHKKRIRGKKKKSRALQGGGPPRGDPGSPWERKGGPLYYKSPKYKTFGGEPGFLAPKGKKKPRGGKGDTPPGGKHTGTNLLGAWGGDRKCSLTPPEGGVFIKKPPTEDREKRGCRPRGINTPPRTQLGAPQRREGPRRPA